MPQMRGDAFFAERKIREILWLRELSVMPVYTEGLKKKGHPTKNDKMMQK